MITYTELVEEIKEINIVNKIMSDVKHTMKLRGFEKIIKKWGDDWNFMYEYIKLPEDFLRYYTWNCRTEFWWKKIWSRQKVSEQFIRDYIDKVDWKLISQYQELSVEFLKEFQDKVDWILVSYGQKFNKEYIEAFEDKLRWNCISQNPNIEIDFIREYKDKLSYWHIKDTNYKVRRDELKSIFGI